MSFDKNNLPSAADYYSDQGLTVAKSGSKDWRRSNCPFCQSRDNFNINLKSGGFHCWGCDARGGDLIAFQMMLHGQDFTQACKALGIWRNDGTAPSRKNPLPFSYRDALTVLAPEAQLVAISGATIGNGKPLTTDELSRVLQAVGRINRLMGGFQ